MGPKGCFPYSYGAHVAFLGLPTGPHDSRPRLLTYGKDGTSVSTIGSTVPRGADATQYALAKSPLSLPPALKEPCSDQGRGGEANERSMAFYGEAR